MTNRSKLLLLGPAAVAGLAALFCAVTQQRKSTALLGDIRNSVKQNAAQTRALHHILRRQRGAISDIHNYLIPVTKGSSKQDF